MAGFVAPSGAQSGLAVVRSIDGPTAAEGVAEEIQQSIMSGSTPPGGVLSLKEVASAHRVKITSLMEAMRRLHSDRLVTMRGDVVIVTPLDGREVASVFKMRMEATAQLSARAAEVASPAHFTRLRKFVDNLPAEYFPMSWEASRQFYRKYVWELMRPAASSVELRVLYDAWEVSRRYERYGWEVVNHGQSPSFANQDEGKRFYAERLAEITEIYTSRRVRAVYDLVASNISHTSEIAHQSLGRAVGPADRDPWLVS